MFNIIFQKVINTTHQSRKHFPLKSRCKGEKNERLANIQ